MSNLLKMMGGRAAVPLYSDDVFSAYTYTGNGSTQTITNGIDLAGEGGMVWIKNRVFNIAGGIFDTTRGITAYFLPPQTGGSNTTAGKAITAFNSNGFDISDNAAGDFGWNGSPGGASAGDAKYVSWTFRNANNFFGHQVVVKSGGSNQTALFPELTTLGMVRVKRTDAAGSWYIWHRSLTAGKLLIGETTAAEATLGHITVSGTTVTLVNGVIADGTYLVEAWAHDTSAEGIVQCGTFTADGSGNVAVTLGFEPQFIITKPISASFGWKILDTIRRLDSADTASGGYMAEIYPHLSGAESLNTGFGITATGFKSLGAVVAGATYIYLAIRRPNKPPTVGTQVYNAIARTGTGAAATVTGVGFAPDIVIAKRRSAADEAEWFDRLRGATKFLWSPTIDAEQTDAISLTSFDMDGFSLGADGTWGKINFNARTYINWCLRRYPGVFDQVCYTGTGSAHTEAHNLTVVPELMIVKRRSGAGDWSVYHATMGATKYTYIDGSTELTSNTYWNDTAPTSSVFTVGSNYRVNNSGDTYTNYLFATFAGISKVGSYTGTAATLQINCGFTTGARFVLIKRTDSTGDWYVWDTVRGIIAGNDPYLLLNSTAAEVTTTDYIDPYSAGFEISSTAPAAINASGGSYIYFSVA